MIKVFINQNYLIEANQNKNKAEKVMNIKPKCVDIKLRITKDTVKFVVLYIPVNLFH